MGGIDKFVMFLKKSYEIIPFYLVIFLSGCQFCAKSPLGQEPTTQDFKVMTTPIEVGEPNLKKNQKILLKNIIPQVYKTSISLHISQDLPLYVALEKIGQLLNIDIQISENIQNKSLAFSATQKPFINVLESICGVAKLRYRIENDLLFLEPDTFYSHSYNVQFLNFVRSSENKISSGTDIFTHSVSNLETGVVSSSNSNENGSNTSVSMNSENNFWKELEVNLQTLLCSFTQDAQATQPRFSIHKQAGMISVWGTSEQHYRVKEYLDLLRKSVSSQILIEAKVVEVTLHEDFKSGIDWGILNTKEGGVSDENQFYGGRNFTGMLDETVSNSLEGSNTPAGFFQYTTQLSSGLMGIIKTLQHFGSTRTLSSPRLTVMNNQSAVLKVAKNHVYFKLNYNKHFYTRSSYEDISVGSDIQTVPIGLVMSVQPAIDPINKSVILFLRPTISRLVESVDDPSVAIASQKNSKDSNQKDNKSSKSIPVSRVPVIEVKEIDSVLRLKDNEVAILGGLMETHSSHNRYKNPLLGDIPIIKEAFSSLKKEDVVTEVVILIRVKILDFVTPNLADERLIHLYMKDPRPIC